VGGISYFFDDVPTKSPIAKKKEKNLKSSKHLCFSMHHNQLN
jgi:hypothetical protein